MVRRNVKKRTFKKKSYTYKGAKKRTSYKKATFAKTGTKVSRQLRNDFALPGIKNLKVVTLPYNTQAQLVCTSGVHNIWNFKMNDIYDPDVTNVGHQPFGHDQWALYYTKYTVIGAKITASFNWNSQRGPTNVVCGIIADENTSLPTTVHTKQERYPGCTKTLIANSNGHVTVDAFYSMKKWFSKKTDDSHQHVTPFGSSPFLPAYFNVFVQSTDGTTSSNPVHVDISISYIVKMIEPKDVLGS